MNRLPPGAEMTREKLEIIRTRQAIQRIRGMRLRSLLSHFRHRWYTMTCPCALDTTPSPHTMEGLPVARGHPLYALVHAQGCAHPVFWEVTPNHTRKSMCGENGTIICDTLDLHFLRTVDKDQPEWNLELVSLLAEFHEIEQIRRGGIQVLWALGATTTLLEIAGREKYGSYTQWLAEKLARHQDPWSNWVLRHCHLKIGHLD